MAQVEPDLRELFESNRLTFSPRNAGKSEANRLLVQALRAAGQEVLEVGPRTHRSCNDIDHAMDAARYVAAHDSPVVQNAHRSHLPEVRPNPAWSEEEFAEFRKTLLNGPQCILPQHEINSIEDHQDFYIDEFVLADNEQSEEQPPDHTLAELIRKDPKIQIIMEGDSLPDEIEINGVRFLREKPIDVRIPQGRRVKL